eukprot:222853-Pelagomonas_calceolata.AAC.2
MNDDDAVGVLAAEAGFLGHLPPASTLVTYQPAAAGAAVGYLVSRMLIVEPRQVVPPGQESMLACLLPMIQQHGLRAPAAATYQQ